MNYSLGNTLSGNKVLRVPNILTLTISGVVTALTINISGTETALTINA